MNGMKFKQTRQGYVDALIELATELPNLVTDSDVAKASKTCDFEEAFPDRFFNCGAQEQNMLSVAAGLAIEGFLPFATTFCVFATCRAGDQLRNSIAYPRVNVKIGCTHGGISTGGDGASHQTNEDIAIVRALPNMTVLVPGDYEEAEQATKAAREIRRPGLSPLRPRCLPGRAGNSRGLHYWTREGVARRVRSYDCYDWHYGE